MAKLFLTSSFADSYQQLETFIGEELKGKTVAFFDTASETEERTSYVDKAVAAFEILNMIVKKINIYSHYLEKDISTADYIYVAGGNTFYLLQELKKSGADLLIKQHIETGKNYIGESAGSIIMSPDIHYIKHMDDITKAPSLDDYTGFNFIHVYPLPHVGNKYLDSITKEIINIYQDKLPLHPFTDKEVLLVEI